MLCDPVTPSISWSVPSWLRVPEMSAATRGHNPPQSCGKITDEDHAPVGLIAGKRRLRKGIAMSAIQPFLVTRPSESHTVS